jgi:hypothetical protein
MRTGTIDTMVGNTTPLDIRSQTKFSSTNQTPITIDNSLGPRVKIKNNNISWLMGVRGGAGTGTDAQFVIGVDGSDFAFRIGTDGTIYANNIILDSDSSSATGVVRANRAINTTDGITGGGNLTADRTLGLTGNALAFHSLSANGIVTKTSSGSATVRTITQSTGIVVTNGNGVSGNPTIAVDAAQVMLLSTDQIIAGAKTFSTTISGSINGNANTVTNGVYTTGPQTIGGVKTFTSPITVSVGVPYILLQDTTVGAADWRMVVGSSSFVLQTDVDAFATNKLLIDTVGNLTAAGNITAFSDERLKTNIRTVDNALDKVSRLRGVYFDKDGMASMGVIAQEVEKVIPEVVLDGEYKSVAYGNIVGVLIEAIKELKAELDLLKRGN